MDKEKGNIENVFQHAFEKHTEQPSDVVLRNLRRKLFFADFVSLNFRKFNIVYAGSALLIVLTAVYYSEILEMNASGNAGMVKQQPYTNQNESLVALKKDASSTSNEAKGNLPDASSAFFEADVLTGCAPLTVSFTNQSVNADAYRWDFGNGEISTQEHPNTSYRQAGVYKIKLSVTNSLGNVSEYIQTVEVFEKPQSDFTINVDDSDIGMRLTAFENKSKGAKSYHWGFGDRTTSELETPTHKYAKYSTYQVRLISVSDKGCADTLIQKNSFLENDYRLIFPSQFKPSTIGANNGFYDRPENEPFVFYPRNVGAKKYLLTIEAPNGIEVFTSTDIQQGWNGYIRGRLAPAGVYSYKASGIYPNGKAFAVDGKFKMVVDTYFDNY
jgi:PKD repeat protein